MLSCAPLVSAPSAHERSTSSDLRPKLILLGLAVLFPLGVCEVVVRILFADEVDPDRMPRVHAVLERGDGPVLRMRRWCEQFYTEHPKAARTHLP